MPCHDIIRMGMESHLWLLRGKCGVIQTTRRNCKHWKTVVVARYMYCLLVQVLLELVLLLFVGLLQLQCHQVQCACYCLHGAC
jgi:hypothetical protein